MPETGRHCVLGTNDCAGTVFDPPGKGAPDGAYPSMARSRAALPAPRVRRERQSLFQILQRHVVQEDALPVPERRTGYEESPPQVHAPEPGDQVSAREQPATSTLVSEKVIRDGVTVPFIFTTFFTGCNHKLSQMSRAAVPVAIARALRCRPPGRGPCSAAMNSSVSRRRSPTPFSSCG
jgi:hypothetical protein